MTPESPKARQAWADYLALGPERSLEKLLERYRTDPRSAPTARLTTLKEWSRTHQWQARLQNLVAEQVVVVEQAERDRVREVLETGFGVAHERVRVLKELGEILIGELRDPLRRWVREPKWLGSRENGEMVEIERFNAAEVEQFRGILDDIAKEIGGRKFKAELTGKDGGAIETAGEIRIEHTVDDESARVLADLIARGLNAGPSAAPQSS